MSDDLIEIPDVDEVQLMKVFETISQLIKTSIKTSPDIGGKNLASIHYKLFLDLYENKNEKSRLALLYLQAQLGNLISEAGKSQDIGMVIYAYTRHWLKFVLILETQMASLLSWYTFRQILPINLVPLISSIDEYLPINVDENASGLPDNIVREFKEFADAANEDAGEELKKWLSSLMRAALFYQDKDSLDTLRQFQVSSPELMNVDPTNFQFNTLFHQYGESWYQEILNRKKWISTLIDKLDLLSDNGILRMARGFYWTKFQETPLSLIIKKNST